MDDDRTVDLRESEDHPVRPENPAPAPERYVILEQIGSGGMGVVHTAWDRELDRKVALKLLHGTSDTTSRQRLVREAQAMAKLAHPNVVTVHDVGEHRGQTFIAMEYVDGENLGVWLQERTRDWREIVSVLLQAGRGLAAAHRAGLVHRDFKPGNVLVGRDGRVRVADFGLARATEADRLLEDGETVADHDPEASVPSLSRGALATPLTVPGAMIGTPRYMAPEQVRGARADARTDQFAFCLTLYEALWNRHPFGDGNLTEHLQRVAEGRIDPPPTRGVPARVRRAILRGLSFRPEDRFPDMDSLLAELAHDPAIVRRRWMLAGAALLAAGLVVVAAVELHARRAALCSGGMTRTETVWNPDRKANVERAFVATGLPGARVVYRRIANALDAKAAHWVDCFNRTCAASRLRGETSAEVLDRQMACLELRLAELDAFVSLLETADATFAVSSLESLRNLPDPEPCTSAAEILQEDPLPADPVRRQVVEAARTRLAKGEALYASGRYKEAVRVAAELDEAGDLSYQPLRASVLLLAGMAHAGLGEAKKAEDALRRSLVAAQRGGAQRVAARAAGEMARLDATVREKPLDALWWSDLAEAQASRLPRRVRIRRELLQTRVSALQAAGKYAEALDLERRVFRETVDSESTPAELATANDRLADVLFSTGAYEDAVNHYRKAVALRTEDLGPDHPLLAASLVSLGAALSKLNRGQEALDALGQALAIEKAALGDRNPILATCLNNLAYVYEGLGDYDRALETYDEVLDLLGESWGADHPDAAFTQINRASVLRRLGHLPEAIEAARESGRILETAYGPDHPMLAYALNAEGVLLLEAGKPRPATRALLRALKIREDNLTDPLELAETRFSLAKALCAAGERARASAEARRARTVFAGQDRARAREDLESYESWHASTACR